MTIRDQIKNISPSVREALFRRLLIEDDLSYLRKDNTIIGFEVDLDQAQELSGYSIIAMQKHTILAYRSDLEEEPRLIMFPNLYKLEDPAFGLQNIQVNRQIFDNSQFQGKQSRVGTFKDVSQDLVPPYKTVEVSDEMASQMHQVLHEETMTYPASVNQDDQDKSNTYVDTPVMNDTTPPMDDDIFGDQPPMDEPPMDEPPMDEPPMDNMGFDDTPSYMPPHESKPQAKSNQIVPQTPQGQQLNQQSFKALSEVSDYMIMTFGLNHDLVSNVLTAALRATTDEKTQIDVAVLLFIKLFNEHQI